MEMIEDKAKDSIFLLLCILTAFNNIPDKFSIRSIGVVGDKAVFFPLVIGLLYMIWRYKKNIEFPYSKRFVSFLGIYLTTLIISLLIGIYNYPINDNVSTGIIHNAKWIEHLVNYLNIDVNARDNFIVYIWFFGRSIKQIILDSFWYWCGAYLIFSWYCYRSRECIQILYIGVCISSCIVIIIGGFDFLYLAGSDAAKKFLEYGTPYIHTIKQDGLWWPPLLWKGQLRSIFAEPSYLAIWASMVLPLIWYGMIKYLDNWRWLAINCILITGIEICVFMTRTRTATYLLLGELIIFTVALLWIYRKSVNMKVIIVFFAMLVISFGVSSSFIANGIKVNSDLLSRPIINQDVGKYVLGVDNYIQENITSLTSKKERSNGSRYSIMLADVQTGIDHPLLGVGTGLRDIYILKLLNSDKSLNSEVKSWVDLMEQNGIAKQRFPKLGEYTSRFAETGILGLILYLFPTLFLIYKFGKKIYKKKYGNDYLILITCLSISLMGGLGAQIGDTVNVSYFFWVLLGCSYSVLYDPTNRNNNL